MDPPAVTTAFCCTVAVVKAPSRRAMRVPLWCELSDPLCASVRRRRDSGVKIRTFAARVSR
jgi:hypothetical protein